MGNKFIAIMTERIVRDFDPLQIILFGSQARGDADRHSDIDLLSDPCCAMPNRKVKYSMQTTEVFAETARWLRYAEEDLIRTYACCSFVAQTS